MGAPLSHAVIVSREFGVPCACSVHQAAQRIPDGALVTVDGNTGSTWNYGSNFGGPTKSSWTSGADIVHDGMNEGMFGSFGIVVGQGGVTRMCVRGSEILLLP